MLSLLDGLLIDALPTLAGSGAVNDYVVQQADSREPAWHRIGWIVGEMIADALSVGKPTRKTVLKGTHTCRLTCLALERIGFHVTEAAIEKAHTRER